MTRISLTLFPGLMALSLIAAQNEKSNPAPPRTVSVLLEQANGTEWRPVDPHRVFRANDEIRFRFRSNFSGYLYVLNETSAGQYLWLFPTKQTGVDNRVTQDQEYADPAKSGSFCHSSVSRLRHHFWILSPVSLAKIPDLTRILGSQLTLRSETHAPLLPRCQESTLRAEACLD